MVVAVVEPGAAVPKSLLGQAAADAAIWETRLGAVRKSNARVIWALLDDATIPIVLAPSGGGMSSPAWPSWGVDRSVQIAGISFDADVDELSRVIEDPFYVGELFTRPSPKVRELLTKAPPPPAAAPTPAEAARRFHVFLCHNHDDKPLVREIAKRLSAQRAPDAKAPGVSQGPDLC